MNGALRSRRALSLAALLLVAAFVAGACGDDGTGDPVEFGQGEIPSTFPGDIPVPPGAVIGSTMIDRVNHRSEFAVTAALEMTTTIQYFLVELVNAGYVVESSSGAAAQWTITFTQGDLSGDVNLVPQGTGSTLAVVSINRS